MERVIKTPRQNLLFHTHHYIHLLIYLLTQPRSSTAHRHNVLFAWYSAYLIFSLQLERKLPLSDIGVVAH